MKKTLKKGICFLIIVALFVTAVPLYNTDIKAASGKYTKHKRTWSYSGNPTHTMKISSISSHKIKFKLQVAGAISVKQKDGSYLVTGNFKDSTKTITKKLKKGRSSFTIKTKKGYKLKVKIKLGKYYKRSGLTMGASLKIKSSNKIWNSGYWLSGSE